jgi:hypothetical protein
MRFISYVLLLVFTLYVQSILAFTSTITFQNDRNSDDRGVYVKLDYSASQCQYIDNPQNTGQGAKGLWVSPNTSPDVTVTNNCPSPMYNIFVDGQGSYGGHTCWVYLKNDTGEVDRVTNYKSKTYDAKCQKVNSTTVKITNFS